MRLLAGVLTLFLTTFAIQAADYKEGEHYIKVTPLEVEGPEVREFFSFYCGHCFQFEKLVKSIKANLPEDAKFVKNHVNFMGTASKKMQTMLSRAFVTAHKLDMADVQIASIFAYIHTHNAVPTSINDMRNVFVLNGADGEKFDTLMASKEVQAAVDEMVKYQDILSSTDELTKVPTVIVNGKYKIDTHHLDPNNIEEDYNNLVKYLLSLD